MQEIIHSPRVVMMCYEKKYNPQGGSLLTCIVTQGGCVTLANPALSKV